MKCIFLLSGDYIKLGAEEVFSLFDVKNYKFVDKFLITELNGSQNILNKTFKRLALTKSIYKFLFECDVNELIDSMKGYDWNSVYKDSFCLRMNYFDCNNEDSITKKLINERINKKQIKKLSNASEQIPARELAKRARKQLTRSQLTEENLAGYIWHSVTNPKVDLKNPKTWIELFFIKNKVYCGLLIKEINANFESRKSHLRPFPHPSSLHPKLARALVNISGIRENQILLDPFCGTGGFLIEAGLMGVNVIGYDISKNMAKGCKENLEYFKIKKFNIVNKNALQINKKIDYVITDLPYGLNSNVYLGYNKKSIKQKNNKINLKIKQKNQIQNIEKFYLKFLKKLRRKLKKKAVIIFPHYANYKKLLKTAKFKIEKEFEIYVHRSLTRKIVRICKENY